MKTVLSAEIIKKTAAKWKVASGPKRRLLLTLPFVADIRGNKILFIDGCSTEEVDRPLKKRITELVGRADVRYHFAPKSITERVIGSFSQIQKFKQINFGSDIAENDPNLLRYFISTDAYKRVLDRHKSIVIGPKGSGKSAILRAVEHASTAHYKLSITPENFATSMLSELAKEDRTVFDEREPLIITWMFSILVEVFKRVCENPRGVSKPKMLKPIRDYLHENSAFASVDLFSRFVGYLKQIQGIKIGDAEISIKTRDLRKLYALEPLYELVPNLRGALKEEVLVLIDELDRGWDNSAHANSFLAALVQAAMRIRALDSRIHVIVFVRSEIFELVKGQLEQLDKLRGEIIDLHWDSRELAGLLMRRLAYSLKVPETQLEDVDTSSVHGFLPNTVLAQPAFEYVVSRTTMRPRETLQLVRTAHEFAVKSGKDHITEQNILDAEKVFSGWKLDHVCIEYLHIYPKLRDLLEYFRGFGPVLSRGDVLELVNEYRRGVEGDPACDWIQCSENDRIKLLYGIEFLGAETAQKQRDEASAMTRYVFAYSQPSVGFHHTNSFAIHPAFWNALELSRI